MSWKTNYKIKWNDLWLGLWSKFSCIKWLVFSCSMTFMYSKLSPFWWSAQFSNSVCDKLIFFLSVSCLTCPFLPRIQLIVQPHGLIAFQFVHNTYSKILVPCTSLYRSFDGCVSYSSGLNFVYHYIVCLYFPDWL